ncbi:MAG: type II toxin-antitoxin system RelE/ParE family toxin [Nitrospiria bacterium]
MPKSYRVKITRSAEEDIEDIYDYVHRDSPQVALAFIDELESQISSLEHFPLRCPTIPESTDEMSFPYRHLIYGEYRTIFRVEGRTVYILRVIHGARLLSLDIL